MNFGILDFGLGGSLLRLNLQSKIQNPKSKIVMILARVVGNIVATQKDHRYEGARILVVRPIETDGSQAGEEMLALDSVDAGVGDTVVVVREGWSASTASTGSPGAAIDSAIVGVVDVIDFER